MSDDKTPPRPKLDGYHEIELANLRTDTKITFDCHVFLPANQKLIHWLRAGAIFGPLHAEKLQKLGNPKILIPQDQVASYEAYAQVSKNEAKAKPNSNPAADPQAGSGMIHIKGDGPPESETVRVFGGAIAEPDLGKVAIKSAPAAATAAAPAKPSKPKMQIDVDFINVSIKAIQSVFASICQINLTFQAPEKRTATSRPPFPVNVASFIDLNSSTIRGTIGLCFPSLTYLNLLSAATGLKFAQLNDNVMLGSGEFMSHIFATARPGLEAIGYNVDLAVPFLVSGEDIAVSHILPGAGFSFLIKSDVGQFQYEIGIKTGG